MATKKAPAVAGHKHDINDLMDAVEKKFRLTSLTTDVEARRSSAVPTGILGLDVMMGGGIIPGHWITVYGGEGAAKSTSLAAMLGSLAAHGVKGNYWDFEGSTDSVYLGNLLEAIGKLSGTQMTAGQIFGVQDPKTGKWKTRPMFRLYSESIGDALFDAMSSLARNLPDKVYNNGKWYYIFTEKPAGMTVNAKLSSRGEYYVEAADGYPEMIIFADSYPMMYPESLDEDGKGAGMAAVARMFSANIPKLMGKLKKKGITVIGVNQLRLKPGVSYGNPEYEPAGQAVKYASSIRISNAARSVPHGKGPIEEEQSVLLEGNDQYKYVLMKLTKNKGSVSVGLESWQRVWAADPSGNAHGFCPVWNVYDYLVLTGQAARFGTGKVRKIMMNLWTTDGEKVAYVNEKMQFVDLKNLVLLEEEDRKAYARSMGMSKEDYLNFFTSNKLFTHLQAQVHNGTGLAFAFALKNGVSFDGDPEAGEDLDEPDVELEEDEEE